MGSTLTRKFAKIRLSFLHYVIVPYQCYCSSPDHSTVIIQGVTNKRIRWKSGQELPVCCKNLRDGEVKKKIGEKEYQ